MEVYDLLLINCAIYMTGPHMPSQLQFTTTVTTFLYMNIILNILRKTGNVHMT